MTHLDGLVQALLDDPGDNTLRLVFRDWLSDQEDPALRARGELLAVQDELAAWVPDLQRRLALQSREQELIGAYRSHWLGLLTAYDHRFEQGVVHLTLSAAQFFDPTFSTRAATLLRHGWVRTIRLTALDASHLKDLSASPHLEAVVALDLRGANLDDHIAHALAASPHVKHLQELNLSGNRLTGSALHALARTTWARQLTGLILRDNRLDGDDFDTIVQHFPRLRILELEGNRFEGPVGQVWLAWSQAHSPLPAPGTLPTRLVNTVGMTFALIPSGTFLMGSADDEPGRKTELADEGPQHEVTISRPFYYGIYPVTQRDYQAVMGDNPSHFDEDTGGGPDHPVESVTWEQACEFCRRLSRRPEEASAGRAYRLPSEAEWEHACRAGTTTRFWWGNSATYLDANYYQNERTTPVGSYRPNPFGLYDVHGNVWEWCADWYNESYYRISPPVDPPGSDQDGRRSTRGGSWSDQASRCRSAHRDFWYGNAYAANKIGLRVVLTLPGEDVTGGLPASFAPPPD